MRVIGSAPDDPATARLLDAYFIERVAGFTPGDYRVAPPDPAAFLPPGTLLRVDDDDGTPLATGGLRAIPPAEGVRMEVKHLYVVPEARGRGLGRMLLTRLEEAARAAGADLLVLDTNRALEAAGGLYRSAGFDSVPPFNDNPNATDWFAKRLTDPAPSPEEAPAGSER